MKKIVFLLFVTLFSINSYSGGEKGEKAFCQNLNKEKTLKLKRQLTYWLLYSEKGQDLIRRANLDRQMRQGCLDQSHLGILPVKSVSLIGEYLKSATSEMTPILKYLIFTYAKEALASRMSKSTSGLAELIAKKFGSNIPSSALINIERIVYSIIVHSKPPQVWEEEFSKVMKEAKKYCQDIVVPEDHEAKRRKQEFENEQEAIRKEKEEKASLYLAMERRINEVINNPESSLTLDEKEILKLYFDLYKKNIMRSSYSDEKRMLLNSMLNHSIDTFIKACELRPKNLMEEEGGLTSSQQKSLEALFSKYPKSSTETEKRDEIEHVRKALTQKIAEIASVSRIGGSARVRPTYIISPEGVDAREIVLEMSQGLNLPLVEVNISGTSQEKSFLGLRPQEIEREDLTNLQSLFVSEDGQITPFLGRLVEKVVESGVSNPIVHIIDPNKVLNVSSGEWLEKFLLMAMSTDPEKPFKLGPLDLNGVTFILSGEEMVSPKNDPSGAIRNRFEIIKLPGMSKNEKITKLTKIALARLKSSGTFNKNDKDLPTAVKEMIKKIVDYDQEIGITLITRVLEEYLDFYDVKYNQNSRFRDTYLFVHDGVIPDEFDFRKSFLEQSDYNPRYEFKEESKKRDKKQGKVLSFDEIKNHLVEAYIKNEDGDTGEEERRVHFLIDTDEKKGLTFIGIGNEVVMAAPSDITIGGNGTVRFIQTYREIDSEDQEDESDDDEKGMDFSPNGSFSEVNLIDESNSSFFKSELEGQYDKVKKTLKMSIFNVNERYFGDDIEKVIERLLLREFKKPHLFPDLEHIDFSYQG